MREIIDGWMRQMVAEKASDIYLTVKRRPQLRIDDKLVPLGDEENRISFDKMEEIVKCLTTPEQYEQFLKEHEMNLSFGVAGVGRFRVNIMQQRQSPALVIRAINNEIPSFADLGLPEMMGDLVMNKRGIIMLCGMTGSGKSTTLASMIDYRNEKEPGHIITIEDPVEFLHTHKKCIVTQREVGVDTESYFVAVKNSFRQKPDVILIGEVRDKPVMEQALVAAETGHLCLATLHANNAYQAIERMLNFFKQDERDQARINLAMNLRAIVSQRLIPAISGGRVLVYEILLNQGYIKELIVKGDTSQIRDVMAKNKTTGMNTFDQMLLELYQQKKISAQTAIAESDYPVDMSLSIKKLSASGGDTGGDADDGALKGIDTSSMTFR